MAWWRMVAALVLMTGAGCTKDAAPTPASGASAPAAPAPSPSAKPPAAVATGHMSPMDGVSTREVLRAHEAPVLLVNVWSTWCEPCVEEFPELVRVGADYRERGLGTVFISVDPESEWPEARAFLEAQGAPTPNYVKTGPDDRFIETLHAGWSGALPATLLLDRERRVRKLWEEPVTREMIKGPIEELLHANKS